MKLVNSDGKTIPISHPEKYSVKWKSKSRSKFQERVKNLLEPYWKYHIVFEEFPVPFTRMSLDFFNYSLNIAIEVQGSQHLGYNKFFHGGNNYKYLTQMKRDIHKLNFCESFGIKLIEIYPNDELSTDLLKKMGAISE